MQNESCQSSKAVSSIKYGELQWVFTYFDEDGDGKISAAELQSCLRTTAGRALSDEEAETAVRTSDADGDGMLGFDDFAMLMETAGEDEKIQELREAFRMYSATTTTTTTTTNTAVTGYITPKSLKKMLTQLGQSTTISDCKAMIQKFDINGDGVLSFDEFSVMMR